MEKITRQTRANDAAKWWADQYKNYGGYKAEEKVEIGKRLAALGPEPNPDDVDSVVGNTSWTDTPMCDACGEDNKPLIVAVGYGHLCADCIATLAAFVAE